MLLLAVLVHMVSAHAGLEGDGVSVLTEVFVETDRCNPASPTHIYN